MYEITSYRIVFEKNLFDIEKKEHKFKFSTYLYIRNAGPDFTKNTTTDFKQFVSSKAINPISKEVYLNSGDLHDDNYTIDYFSDIGQSEPGTNIYRTDDTPGVQKDTFLTTTQIHYEFEFYQTIGRTGRTGRYVTPTFKVLIRGAGNHATMKVQYNSKSIDVLDKPVEVRLV